MNHPKVVIVGAGSLFFGRKAIWQMVHSQALNGGTLGLVDTDADRLKKMSTLAEKVIEHNKSSLTLEASTDHRDVLKDADFVVLCFADRNAHFRGVDVDTSARYGIRMCSGDTIGPGGIMRTLRELPQIVEVCKSIEELCPDAWIVNYINPTSVMGIALAREFPNLNTLALCDAQWGLSERYAGIAGVEADDKWTLRVAGPNHFTWLLQAEYDGQDVLPTIVDHVRQSAEDDLNKQAQGGKSQAKGFLNNQIAIELYEAFGVLPTVLGHTKEYVRFYQGHGVTQKDQTPPLKLFEVPERVAWTNRVWDRVDEYLSGNVNISEFDTEFGSDPATDLIEKMWTNSGEIKPVNVMNNGAVPNMPVDSFLELYCTLSMEGCKPLPCPPMPRGIRSLCENVLDTHELTAEAALRTDRTLLRRAFLTDPLTNSIADTDALIDELLEAERDAVAPGWFASAEAEPATVSA